jgi:hypothetical protein
MRPDGYGRPPLSDEIDTDEYWEFKAARARPSMQPIISRNLTL